MSMGGHERTYQSWYGTPQSRIENDIEGMLTHAANNGYTEAQTANLLNSGRTYNYYLYEDQVDDYTQNHYQLHLDHVFSNVLKGKITGFYTRGFGYYEQFREGDTFSEIGLDDVPIASTIVSADTTDEEGNLFSQDFIDEFTQDDASYDFIVQTDENGDTLTDANGNALLAASAKLTQTDLVRQRWLDNHYYGTLATITYSKGGLRELTGGVNLATYDGAHYGKLVWMEHATVPTGYRFYEGTSLKRDAAAFVKGVFAFPCRLEITADMQLRQVNYVTSGSDVDLRYYDVNDDLLFFNPKLGVAFSRNLNVYYASASVANREPSRSDYVDAPQGVIPKHESMLDLEGGFRHYNPEGISWNINGYAMLYRNQLVLTGELNDVGAPIRTNVPESYRAGIESEIYTKVARHFTLSGNLTISRNRIVEFNEVLYDYTTDVDVVTNKFSNTDISFSPGIIASLEGMYSRKWTNGNQFQAGIVVKHVGKQYLDNTSNASRMLSDYTVADGLIHYEFAMAETSRASVGLRVMNLLNRKYSANGYTYSYIYGETITENFFYPQATRYFMLEAALTFGK
jgi:iron complex outermembrane receptor protein